MSVVVKSYERLVLAHLKDITGPLLDPLPFPYRPNRSVDDSVSMGLYYTLQHHNSPWKCVTILFVVFNLAFNPIIPDTLCSKLTHLSEPSPVNGSQTDR